MREIVGDIWDYKPYGWIVVPINLMTNVNGTAAMGAGLAAQARDMHPGVDRALHALLTGSGHTADLYVLFSKGPPLKGGLILFPTKIHWRERSPLSLVEEGLIKLKALPITGDIYLPLLGCGYGLLSEKRVLPLLQQHLDRERFILVRRSEAVVNKYPTAFRTTRAPHNPGGAVDRSLWEAR